MKKENLLNLKIKYALLSSMIFVFLYKIAETYTSTLKNVPSFVMNWEKFIPFVPFLILPYMTSGLLFVIIFFLVKTKEDLILLTKRANFMTIISVIIFFIFPLKFSFAWEEVKNPFYNFLFSLLNSYDNKFNQCPSLHVSYSFLYIFVFYTELKTKLKYLYCLWAFTIAISVLFVYQHHFIDFIGGLIIFGITFLIFPNKKYNL